MARISNFTLKAKRRYFDGSSWKIEDLDFFQFASTTIYSGSNILYKREENTTQESIGIVDFAYDYYPGLVYKPKKYYRITDLFFTKEHFENLRTYAKNAFVVEPTKVVYGYINASDDSMVMAENNGLYMYAFARYSAGKTTGIPDRRTVGFHVEVLVTKFSPGNLKYTYVDGRERITVNDNGTWRTATLADFYNSGRRLFSVYKGKDMTYSEWCLLVDNVFNNALKVKYYFTASANTSLINDVTLDGINYGKSGCPNYKNMIFAGLTADYSQLPNFNNSCFAFIYFWVWYYAKPNIQVLRDVSVDTTKSPDPTRNPEDDDPNDDDPGSQGGGGGGGGGEGGDGDHDDSTDPIPEPPIPGLSGTSNGLITAWNLSPSQLATLAKKLWSPDAWEAIKQYFTNPMGAILSLSIIPVAPKTSSGVIHLGGYNTEITANKLGTDYVNFDCGSIPINRYYGSYLDYSPFTKISCYLPYIGEVDIDPDQVMQKTLQIKYHINCITGECVALLLADGSVFANYSGNCAKQMPITQTDFSAIISASVQLCSTLITAGATAGMGGTAEKSLFGATTEATKASESLVKANSSLLGSVMSAKMNYRHSSQLGTGAGQLAPQAPFLTIIRPNLDLADNYKSFTGYPCNKNLNLSSLHGFTQVEACNLSVPSASLEEASEIKELLLKGVIL